MALSQTRSDKINKPGRYGDGRNLYLRVTESGSRSWVLRYELRGRERAMGLGACADFTLEEARERARLARQLQIGWFGWFGWIGFFSPWDVNVPPLAPIYAVNQLPDGRCPRAHYF